MRIFKLFIVAFSMLLLASCATAPTEKIPPQNETQSWGSRVNTLSSVQSWDMNALIAIRNNAPEKKNSGDWSANLKWQQNHKTYTMLLFGPMGAGLTKLSGNPNQVKLETSDGKIFTAATPEQLVAQQTNWILPVSSLYYWVRGLPVPNISAKKHLDAFNHLTQLQQQNWNIQYERYTAVNQIDLPSKIILFNPQLNVKIIIKEWKI